MARGRKPEPAAVKRAKGNPGRRPIVEDPALPVPAGMASMPDWLDTSDLGTAAAAEITTLAKRVWAELRPELERINIIAAPDRNALARYCRYMAEWIIHTRTIDREGTHYVTSSEHVGELRRPHPAMRFRKDCEQALKELGEAMGLTPAARQALFIKLAATGGQGKLPLGDQEDAPKAPPADVFVSPVGFLGKPH